MTIEKKTMRDVFIEQIYRRMNEDSGIFFLSADFGSPVLDKLRDKFKDRFINVGIAEQNLINISTGLALEGFTVYAYAIAPFVTMRAFEQIRINLALHAQFKDINVNIIGVGAGLSYDVSGPTHHCLEDISVIRTLPNITVFSPSDWVSAQEFIDCSIKIKKPKYIRLDGKPLPRIYESAEDIKFENGLCEIKKGDEICLISTGYMTHTAIKASNTLAEENIKVGIIDVFLLKPINEFLFLETIKRYKYLITMEEAFINKGGLDGLVSSVIGNKNSNIRLERVGFKDTYVFDIGTREHLHKINNIDEAGIIQKIKNIIKNI
ncbi:MAG: transketolase family protein [bacterium]